MKFKIRNEVAVPEEPEIEFYLKLSPVSSHLYLMGKNTTGSSEIILGIASETGELHRFPIVGIKGIATDSMGRIMLVSESW